MNNPISLPLAVNKTAITNLSREDLIVEVMQLQHQVSLLQKMIFGSKSERFKLSAEVPANQLSLGVRVDAIAEVEVKKTTIKEHDRLKAKINPKVHPGRHALPSNLRREEIIIEPAQDVSGCRRIGEEVTEVLEVTPAEFYVKRYVRGKYACKGGESVLIGELPKRVIDKGIAGASVLSMLIISKFIDHLPIYRQIAIFKRIGVSLHYNTVVDWCNQGLDVITPLYEQLKKRVLQSSYIQADETGIKVLDSEKKGNSHQGYLWAYRDVINNLALFEYQPGRGKAGPGQLLKNFKGYLQTDGYAAYDQFLTKQEVTVLHCMAHARRYFMEAEKNDKERSTHALLEIQKLYEIERQLKELTIEQKVKTRQEQAVPTLKALQEWMIEQYKSVTPKSPIGQALAYSMKRWDKLSAYTTDGRLEIDNNRIENQILPIALGRKNYLFAGSHESAQRIAMIYSLLGTCKANGIDPLKWLTNVLEQIPNRTVNNLSDLLPINMIT
jgi:transposase